MPNHSPLQIQCKLNDCDGGEIDDNLRNVLESILCRIVTLEATSGGGGDPYPQPFPDNRQWPGFHGSYYSIRKNSNVTDGHTYSLAYCTESDPAALIFGTGSSEIVCCERFLDRWRVIPDGAAAGDGPMLITNPGGACNFSACYVPLTGASGAGDARGKFWVGNATDDSILTIDPHNSFATDTFSIGGSDTKPLHLVYDEYNDKVFAITNASGDEGTRIVELDPTDGTNVRQSTGWTQLTYLIPTPTKLWLTKRSGGVTDRVQYLDPTDITVAATNPGINTNGADGGTYIPEYDYLAVVQGSGSNNIHMVDTVGDTLISTNNTGSAQYNWHRAWIPELDTLVACGQLYFVAYNIFSTCLTSWAHYATWGDQTNNMVLSWYIPEYREVIAATQYTWWVMPTVIN